MINFEEEVSKFKMSVEIEEVEDNITKNDLTDVIDLIEKASKENNGTTGQY